MVLNSNHVNQTTGELRRSFFLLVPYMKMNKNQASDKGKRRENEINSVIKVPRYMGLLVRSQNVQAAVHLNFRVSVIWLIVKNNVQLTFSYCLDSNFAYTSLFCP